MRCSRCGNESSDTNRFCGMCGAPLRQPPVEVAGEISSRTQQANAPTATTRTPIARPANRPETPAASDAVISGPSFLGLNQPSGSTSPARSKLTIDPHSNSRNLDYLLEDEEPRGGGWKLALIFIALVLAVGFGYLRWKSHGLAWLNQLSSKPSGEVTQPQDPTSTNPGNQSQTAPGAVTPVPPSTTAPPSSIGPAAGANGTPKDATPVASTPAVSTPAASNPTSNSSQGAGSPSSTPAADKDNVPNAAPDGEASSAKASKNAASDDQAVKNSDSAAASDEAAADQPTPAPTKKPTPVVSRPPADTVSDAQRYLYGKGVAQDCDRGLRLLKPVASQGNPKAMIEMGALYSAGLCAPRDLPTAYRWFALALRKDPENQSVQSDLQKLWGEMTQPERQLAIRLSQ